MKGTLKKNFALLLAAAMTVSGITIPGGTAYAASDWENAATFTFSDTGIVSDGAEEDAYTVEGTALTIEEVGTYVLTGTCTDGSVVVKKGLQDVVLVLDGLNLTSATTAAIQCKKTTAVEIIAADGTVNFLEDAAANAENEKAVIKSGDGSSLTLSGTGTVNVTANGKNGIKGGEGTGILVKEQTLNITALDNALASDGSVTVDSGTITITSEEGDGIKSSSDDGDTVSAGTITLNDGEVNIKQASDGIQASNAITIKDGNYHVISEDNAIKSDLSVQIDGGKLDLKAGGDGIKASNMTSSDTTAEDSSTEDTTTATGDIVINAGDITIEAVGDGIQAELNLTIEDGSFDIKTNGGSATTLAEDANSCKALKAGSELTVNGGEFLIDSADDAVHSNEYVTINAGIFDISTGDDGMHADTSLIIGQETGEIQPTIHVDESYEGLEGGTVYVYGGDIDVVASDDGINAAGGSSNGTDPGAPGSGGDGFNPGGGRPGGISSFTSSSAESTSGSSEYAIHINGGNIEVNAGGDGLDSNGSLELNGGTILVYGAAAGGSGSDNAPLDADGAILINGGNIFAAGSSQMVEYPSASSTQKYFLSTSTTYNSGTIVNIIDKDANVLFTETLLKKADYILYSSPEMTSSGSYSVKTGIISGGTGSGNESSGGTGSGNESSGGTGSGNEGSGENGSQTGAGATAADGTNAVPEAGTTLTDTKGEAVYIVTDTAALTAAYAGTTNKTASKITIPATVTIDDITYKVTEVAEKALYKNTKITSVTVGKNVKVIGKSSFEGCKKLKTITLSKNLTSIGERAFCNCTALTKVTIPSKVNKIGKQAFANAKKLKNIVIQTTKLAAKNVGSKAFKGTPKNAVVKVPKSKVKAYGKLLVSKGINKKAKIKK